MHAVSANRLRFIDPGGVEAVRIEIAMLRKRVTLVHKTLDPRIKSLALLAGEISIDNVSQQVR